MQYVKVQLLAYTYQLFVHHVYCYMQKVIYFNSHKWRAPKGCQTQLLHLLIAFSHPLLPFEGLLVEQTVNAKGLDWHGLSLSADRSVLFPQPYNFVVTDYWHWFTSLFFTTRRSPNVLQRYVAHLKPRKLAIIQLRFSARMKNDGWRSSLISWQS